MAISAIGTQAPVQTSVQTDNKQKRLTDNFQTRLKNSADMSDCISVPRTIFKGYLGIMIGTTILTAASFIKNPKVRKGMSLAGLATSLYGTWSFVRPYILKDAVPTVDMNKK